VRATLLDYGVGNIHSLKKAFERAGTEVEVTQDGSRAGGAELLLLPGVGAFGKAAGCVGPVRSELRRRMDEGLPVFAICVGMQILYEASEESSGEGLGFLPGVVRRLDHARLPHVGWNQVRHEGEGLFRGIPATASFYFVHSYAPSPCAAATVATSEYGRPFAAAVRKGNAVGVQFHPEKSGESGARLIRNFLEGIAGSGDRP